MAIHPTALIDPKAEMADDVEVGPYSVIGPDVRVGSGCHIMNHVTMMGHCEIGEENVFHPGTVIGNAPQDFSYKGEPTRLVVGDHNVFREYVTLNRGTIKEEGITRIGEKLNGSGNYKGICW